MASITTYSEDPKELFFKSFQLQAIVLEKQIHNIAGLAETSVQERADDIEQCLAGISRLSNEVRNASRYLPSHDQRTYSEKVKSISDKLQETRLTVAPKPKFSFKNARKKTSAISNSKVSNASSHKQTTSLELREGRSNVNEVSDARGGVSEATNGQIHNEPPSTISNQSFVHIVLSPCQAPISSSGSLVSLQRCVIDMSLPIVDGAPFAGLTLKSITDSLLVCGHVNGPAHVTGVQNSIIIVACRQFRMHECKDCDVYLLCASRPIIEACERVRFAPLPEYYMVGSDRDVRNQWDQVDDFRWLKAEHSPNWSVLALDKRIAEDIWSGTVREGTGSTVNEILKVTLPLSDWSR
ncbi:MAG: hypothetical protein M1827_000280 [Pycnora praestabilis]|nr:MAG: hypothetical protein M1827_000280 [Pycnora praestabilis]